MDMTNINLKKFYRPHRILSRLLIWPRKIRILESYGWYLNICGGWAHPHGMDFMTMWQIAKLEPWQLEYKMIHGSMAALPDTRPSDIPE